MRRGRLEGRRLATVLFTDIVGSTERAIELGDRGWRELLRRHYRAVRGELRRFGGHEVDSAGDGFFATFPQPADAIRCAIAIRAAVRPLNIAVRSAVHTGEVEQIGPKVGGVAVHLAARALSAAEPDEILVTSTVRELVAGSELTFADAGSRTFKGFSEPWHLFGVTGPEPALTVLPADETSGSASFSRRTAIALGGVFGAALVVGVLLVLGVAGQRAGVEPGPNTVHRIDLQNEPAEAMAVARGPTALAMIGGQVWVASEAGTVTRLDPDDDSTQVVGGIGIPTAIAATETDVWIAEGFGGRVARIDAGAVELRDTIELHARRLAAQGDAVWITDDIADRVVRLSSTTLAEDAVLTLEAGSGPRAIAVADGSVWVANELAATVLEIDAATAKAIGQPIGLGSAPTGIAIGAGSIWVTSMDADRIYRINPAQGRVAATIETCDGPDAVVASDDGIWVACRVGRVVRRLDAEGTLVMDVSVDGTPAALALAADGVWVALRSD